MTGACHKCKRTYATEPEDFGLCCGCERDLIGLRIVGHDWAVKLRDYLDAEGRLA